jgi:hypothetical protein
MKITSLYPEIKNLDVSSKQSFLKSWEKVVKNPNIIQVSLADSNTYHFENDCFPIIKNALVQEKKLNLVNQRLIFSIRQANERFESLFGSLDLDITILIGLCNGAGWVLKIDQKLTILFGLEKIIELNWTSPEKIDSLVCHELGHIAHFHLRNSFEDEFLDPTKNSVMQLYFEGFAEHVETLLTPKMHRRGKKWMTFCKKNLSLIKKTYLETLLNKQSTQGFFGDWVSILNQHDLGYYLGQQWMISLLRKYDLIKIAKLSYEKIYEELLIYLTQELGKEDE